MELRYLLLAALYVIAFALFFYDVYMKYKRGELKKYKKPNIDPFDYLFKPMPPGTFNEIQPFNDSLAWLYALAVYGGCGWAIINVPELFKPMLIYLILAVIVGMVSAVERIEPVETRATAMVALGYGEWDEQILAGFAIAVPFVLFSLLGMKVVGWQVLAVEESAIASFILTVILAPMVEEVVFRNLIGFSAAEKFGYVIGVLLSASLFAIAHTYVYSGDLQMMIVAFIFGAVAQIVDYYYFSMLPGWVAHTIVNLAAFVASP